MDREFDVVVIGAGNGGLSAAANAAKLGLKTLIIEQHNLPGGYASSFRRGRFEFECALHEFCDIGSEENPGTVRTMLNSLGAEVEWLPVPEAYRLITTDEGKNNLDVTMPFGTDAFADAVERAVPGSRTSVERFIALGKQVLDAMAYIGKSKGKGDPREMQRLHGDFLKSAGYSVNRVLRALKMPKKAQRIINAYWCYLGVDCNTMNFALYAAMVYRYLSGGGWIPKYRSHEISLSMESRIRALGGDIWYNTRVEKILLKAGAVCGVETTAGSIACRHVIANCSPHTVFGSMIDPKQVPVRQTRAVNARKLGMRGLVVYLGLNRSAEEIGLMDYSYFIYGSMDTAKEVRRTRSFNDHPMQAAVCLNRANPGCSPEGTCILSLTTLYASDVWGEVSQEEYVPKKREVAERMIRYFERSVGVSLMPHIEEIEIATPVTLARYTENPQGAIYAYEYNDWDTLIPRLMMVKEDQIIEGLRFAGGYGPRGYGYNGTYLGGEFAAKLTRGDMGRT